MQEARYYTRMQVSLGDKARMVEHILPDTPVLDVGCADGSLMNVLDDHGFDAYGVDMDPAVVSERVRTGYADERVFPEVAFGTILCSSVLHEVFSYGNRAQDKGRISNLDDTFRTFARSLAPGGRLVIRDGVRPSKDPMVILPVEKPELVKRYLAESPFATPGLDRTVHLAVSRRGDGSSRIVGSLGDVMEYAFTATWGESSWAREVQEFYGFFTLDEMVEFAARHGFRCLIAESYRQPGYVEHMAAVEFGSLFPDTNALWVFEKI